jgi:hypothetical protein
MDQQLQKGASLVSVDDLNSQQQMLNANVVNKPNLDLVEQGQNSANYLTSSELSSSGLGTIGSSTNNENINPMTTGAGPGSIKMDINNLLQQIMTITNQSLSEAQEK